MISRLLAAVFAAAFFPASSVSAQAPDVPIENARSLMMNDALLEKAGALRESGKLLSSEKVAELLQSPVPTAITLPAPNTERLPGREIAVRARKGFLRLGWYYLCTRCDHWHLDLAGAYAISADGGAVTCHHVLVPALEMREGYLIAVDHTGTVLSVTGILAKSRTMDAAIVQLEGGGFTPLPLNDQIAPGDSAYCYSDPLGQLGYFSHGIVNRFYRNRPTMADPGSLDELKHLRVNVSTDWAPGSSGAAVLDECGNAIGHVATISPLREEKGNPSPKSDATKDGDGAPKQPAKTRFDGATLITLHEAVPARGIIALARAMNESAAKANAEKAAQ